jgi:hypothetical protein
MSGRMKWDRARRQYEVARPRTTERVAVNADESFWRCWKDDRAGMRAAGYRVTKIGRRWVVYLERERVTA